MGGCDGAGSRLRPRSQRQALYINPVFSRMKSGSIPLPALRAVKVLDQLKERIRYLRYSARIEGAYTYWVRASIRFHGVRHPGEMGSADVEQFLCWLAQERMSRHRRIGRPCQRSCFFTARCRVSRCPGYKRLVARACTGNYQSSRSASATSEGAVLPARRKRHLQRGAA